MVSIIDIDTVSNDFQFRAHTTNQMLNQMTTQIRKKLDAHNGELTPQICQEHGLKIFDEFCFKKLRQLGKGAFGEVWMCLQIEDREYVAVKYINVKTKKNEIDIDNLASFLVEKEILEKISHKGSPSIAKFLGAFYELDANANIKYVILVSESGDFTLDKLIEAREAQSKPYQPQEVLALISQLSQGYTTLQELRIYHSDTKLPNLVFSSKNAKYFLIDFGVSKFVAQGENINQRDEVDFEDYATAGTKGWLSPEKAFYWECLEKGEDLPEDCKTFNPFKDDMWALGTCLEKILGTTAAAYNGDEFLKTILRGLKNENSQNRFDSNQLFKFLLEKGLFSQSLAGSLAFQTDLEIATDLNKKRRQEDGFREVFNRLEKAFLPQEMLEVALEECRELVEKFGEPDLRNGVHFIGVLARLGRAHSDNGNHIEALKCFSLRREALEKQYRTRQQEEVADALYNEAFEIVYLGRNKEALGIYEEILEEHPSVCSTLHQIAIQLSCLGFHQNSLEQNQHVLEIRKKIYKTEEHPDVCQTLSQIAFQWSKLGAYQKALEQYQHVHEIRKKIYKTEEHPESCQTLFQIAVQWSYMGSYKKALEQYERVLEIRKKIFKTEEHPDVCTTLHHIATQWSYLGSHQKALELYLHVLEIRKKLFNTEEHPVICTTLSQIAILRSRLKQLPEALAGFERVLEIRRKIYKTDDHPDVQRDLKNVINIKKKIK